MRKILMVHGFYQQHGGEDVVFARESALLESRGHEVVRYSVCNDAVSDMSGAQAAMRTVWNRESHRELSALIAEHRPDIAHFQNIFPLISPAAYYAAHTAGVPVVQSLHNYRLLCPNALLLRDGKPCELCLPKLAKWPSVMHGCYRGSRAASAAVAGMTLIHGLMHSWHRKVTLFIASTQFSRGKFIAGGLPPDRVVVKPNFLEDAHQAESAAPRPRHGALYVGRLSGEKGIRVMLDAWKGIDYPLSIIGDGPLHDDVQRDAGGNIRLLGHQPADVVMAAMHDAAFLIFPSICYENFGLTIVEAFAAGLPVIGSDSACSAEAISDGVSGLLFRTGDADALAARVHWAIKNPDAMREMGQSARAEYAASYTPAVNYEQLTAIYESAAALRAATGL